MKKTLWIAIVGALAASVIAASAQTEVLSGNAVGYVKVDIASQLTIVSMIFPSVITTEIARAMPMTKPA